MIGTAAFEALSDALGHQVARQVREILEHQDPRETFRQLRAAGWPDGRAKSQRQMARRCGISHRTLRRLLAADPTYWGIAADKTSTESDT